jgi:hypothetical protein
MDRSDLAEAEGLAPDNSDHACSTGRIEGLCYWINGAWLKFELNK